MNKLSLVNKCFQCKYFIPYQSINKNEIIHFAKCARFKKIHDYTNVFDYEYTIKCRKDENKCGMIGKYFRPTIWKNKILYVQLCGLSSFAFLLFGSITCSFFLLQGLMKP
jgi:hypothetical protein